MHSQISFGFCFVLTLITIKFDVSVLRLIKNPKSSLVRCFHVSIVCALLKYLLVSPCTHNDHNKISSLHVLIECLILSCFDSVCTLRLLLLNYFSSQLQSKATFKSEFYISNLAGAFMSTDTFSSTDPITKNTKEENYKGHSKIV